MSTEVNSSQSTDPSTPANGGVEPETEPPNTQVRTYKYKLEDFSQSIINRHQQYINYELVEVNKRTAKALEALRDVLKAVNAKLPGPPISLDAVQAAINEVYAANEKVAGWYPPGCSSGSSAGTAEEDKKGT